jgi:hypothetical protein
MLATTAVRREGAGEAERTLDEAALASVRSKDGHLTAQYHRLTARRRKKRVAITVAHSILVTTYHIVRDGVPYRISAAISSATAPSTLSPPAWYAASEPRLHRLAPRGCLAANTIIKPGITLSPC